MYWRDFQNNYNFLNEKNQNWILSIDFFYQVTPLTKSFNSLSLQHIKMILQMSLRLATGEETLSRLSVTC
jgi:hypothetical protein